MRDESRANRSMLLAGLRAAEGCQQHEQQACDSGALTSAAARHSAGVERFKPALCDGRDVCDGRADTSAASHPHLTAVPSTELGHQHVHECTLA